MRPLHGSLFSCILIACSVTPASASPCPQLNLETILARAAAFMEAGAYRAAVDQFYRPCSTTPFVEQGPANLKERFFWEYVDACIFASQRTGISPLTKERLQREAITAADKYVEWFLTLNATEEELLKTKKQHRLGRMVHNLVETYIAIEQRAKVLDKLEEISAMRPSAIGPQSAQKWAEHLMLDQDFKNRRTHEEINSACQTDAEYQLRWELFREFTSNSSRDPAMQVTIRRINTRLMPITCGMRT